MIIPVFVVVSTPPAPHLVPRPSPSLPRLGLPQRADLLFRIPRRPHTEFRRFQRLHRRILSIHPSVSVGEGYARHFGRPFLLVPQLAGKPRAAHISPHPLHLENKILRVCIRPQPTLLRQCAAPFTLRRVVIRRFILCGFWLRRPRLSHPRVPPMLPGRRRPFLGNLVLFLDAPHW
jgi:hypothetical protein